MGSPFTSATAGSGSTGRGVWPPVGGAGSSCVEGGMTGGGRGSTSGFVVAANGIVAGGAGSTTGGAGSGAGVGSVAGTTSAGVTGGSTAGWGQPAVVMQATAVNPVSHRLRTRRREDFRLLYANLPLPPTSQFNRLPTSGRRDPMISKLALLLQRLYPATLPGTSGLWPWRWHNSGVGRRSRSCRWCRA